MAKSAKASHKPTSKSPGVSSTASLTSRAASDPRFASLSTDPRFRLPSKKHDRIELDKRFAHMLKDDDFARKATVDRYGRKVSANEGKKRLERFYRLGEHEADSEEEAEELEAEPVKGKSKAPSYDPAREGGFSSSESSSEEEDDYEALEDEEGVMPSEANAYLNAEQSATGGDAAEGEVTRRLAIVNLDWDNVRAVDIMAVAQSFCPANGRIEGVVVYPSSFGRERMEREQREGPPKELFKTSGSKQAIEDEDEDDEDEDGQEEDEQDEDAIRQSLLPSKEGEDENLDSKALRDYQLTRLRYYYAVMTCDTLQTAQAIYNEMDGREYLTSANFFDMRFIPDQTDFDDDQPRDTCSKVPTGYRPNDFTTDALTHSKVKLTWDADNEKERIEVRKRAFGNGEMAEEDLRAYLGSDTDSNSQSEEDDQAADETKQPAQKESKAEEARRKMRAALGLPVDAPMKSSAKENKPMGGMQITFTPGLSAKESTEKKNIFENRPEDVTEETTVERYRRKEKERKARRKAKAAAARKGITLDENNEEEEQEEAYDPMKDSSDEAEIETQADEGEEDPFNDPFFNDPAAANATIKKQAKKAKRAAAAEEEAKNAEKKRKEKAELELLMADENGNKIGGEHFNMDEIRRAEKAEARKGKKWKKSKRDREAEGKPDDFDLNVEDPRFKGVFESHEFAIDPSNPRYSGTKGMKKLLEEGRKKRKHVVEREERGEKPVETDGIDELVKRVKKRKV